MRVHWRRYGSSCIVFWSSHSVPHHTLAQLGPLKNKGRRRRRAFFFSYLFTRGLVCPKYALMNQKPMVRREALRKLAIFTTVALPATWVLACSKAPNCEDTSALSPEELEVRKNAEYVQQAMQVSKKCDACAQWIAPAPDKCGACKVLKGPIVAEGSCKLFVAKPA